MAARDLGGERTRTDLAMYVFWPLHTHFLNSRKFVVFWRGWGSYSERGSIQGSDLIDSYSIRNPLHN